MSCFHSGSDVGGAVADFHCVVDVGVGLCPGQGAGPAAGSAGPQKRRVSGGDGPDYQAV